MTGGYTYKPPSLRTAESASGGNNEVIRLRRILWFLVLLFNIQIERRPY
jgi:hypothetical protein